MADDSNFARPQGRRTIRRTVGLPGGPGNPMAPVDGRPNCPIRMWDLGDGKPSSTKEKLRQTYLGVLNSIDRIEAHKAEVQKSGKFTPTGVADDVTGFVLSDATPTFKRGRNAIDAAKRWSAVRKIDKHEDDRSWLAKTFSGAFSGKVDYEKWYVHNGDDFYKHRN